MVSKLIPEMVSMTRKWPRHCSNPWQGHLGVIQQNPKFRREDPDGSVKGTQSGAYHRIHHRVYHRVLLCIVQLFEPSPIPFRFLREVTPSDSQGIRAVIPRISRVSLYVLDLNWLTISLTSFEKSEGVIDQILVDNRIACGVLPTVLTPFYMPFCQCCVDISVVRNGQGGEASERGKGAHIVESTWSLCG